MLVFTQIYHLEYHDLKNVVKCQDCQDCAEGICRKKYLYDINVIVPYYWENFTDSPMTTFHDQAEAYCVKKPFWIFIKIWSVIRTRAVDTLRRQGEKRRTGA